MSFFVRLFRRGAGSCSPIIEVRKSVYNASDVKEKPVQLAAVASDSNFVYSQEVCLQRVRGVNRRVALDMSESRAGMHSLGDDLSCTSTSSFPDLERYSITSSVHKSRNSTLFAAEDTSTGHNVILKVYTNCDLTVSSRLKLKSEISLQQRCKACSGVVELLNVVEMDSSTILVQELCAGGTLTEALSRCSWKFSEMQAAALARSLLHTLSFLHEHLVVHRDVRPEHILLTRSGHWKLADFGCAADLQSDHLNARVGHLFYIAPEVLLKPAPEDVFHEIVDKGLSEEELPCYDQKVDVWSLGVVICEALIGRQPFMAENCQELWNEIQRAHNPSSGGLGGFFQQFNLSADAVSFLTDALQPQPVLRKSAKALLQHEWIRKYAAL